MKYLKALVYYLRDISVNTIPSLDLIFNIVKDLDRKSDKQNMKKFNSHPIAERLYQEDKHLLDYVRANNFKKDTFGSDLKEFWAEQSVDLLKGGDYESIRSLINNAIKAGQDKNIGHEYAKDVESRYREDARTTIKTPWDKINQLLQGGLGNGDFGLIFGSPGGGKSWSLVALGGYAVRLGYNVIHYTLELQDTVIANRYDSCITGYPLSDLINFKDGR